MIRGISVSYAIAVAGFVLSYPLIAVGALIPSAWLFLGAGSAGYLSELHLRVKGPGLLTKLGKIYVGAPVRFLLRDMLLLTLLLRVGDLDDAGEALAGFALLALHAARVVHTALAAYIARKRWLPVVTRNVDLSGLHIPDAPPRWLVRGGVQTMSDLGVLPMILAAVGVITGTYLPLAVALIASLGVATAAVAMVLRFALLARRIPPRDVVVRHVNNQVSASAPELVLYFSGRPDSIYQVDMWLGTLAALDRRSCIIMRDRTLMPLLGPTAKPVICLPNVVDVMNFELPSVRIALYPANVANNIHLLRVPGIKHVFIGHGDSDKITSVNPFAKVYDEVWVAGQAARDRWAKANVGVRDEAVVEVGRPQLGPIADAREGIPDPIFTVLYAPTWEGWPDDPFHTSLISMGPRIVEHLLEHAPAIRVLYKPHPLTGARDPAARAAHRSIVAMIGRANRELGDHASAETSGTADRQQPALRRLPQLTTEIDRLVLGDGKADEAGGSRDSYLPGQDPASEVQWLRDQWHASYWASRDRREHRVIDGDLPTLYECFNRADVLIGDISSVVADFVQSGKPYIVANTAGVPDLELRSAYPTAGAAYLLSPDCCELDGLIETLTAGADDAMAAARRTLKLYLLGNDEGGATARFNQAVNRLVGVGDARRLAASPASAR